MNINKILSIGCALLIMVGCDYNDKYFEGYDDITIPAVANFEGDFTGKYPTEGYFTDRAALEAAVNTMLKGMYKYCDKGSTAKVSVLYGDVTPGYKAADVSYELTEDDYVAMGTENGQPGRYKNFDANMDLDAYLIAFCDTKYADLAVGKAVSITYKFYASGAGTSNKIASYRKEASGWVAVDLGYAADSTYTLETEDYDSMGTESGKPGRYDNFDANMDVDLYLTTFLKIKFPYTAVGATCEVFYQYYASGTTTVSRIYKYDGSIWTYFDPYEDTLEVTTKIAEMEFDGTNWVMLRLMGGSQTIQMTGVEYTLLVDWVKANKPEYMSTQKDNEEYYFGSSAGYSNINNAYNTWRNYYNVNGEYNGLSNDELQAIMDKRLASGISTLLLPGLVPTPDPGLTYVVVYNVYQGRGTGNYSMSFVFDNTENAFEWVGGPVAVK